MNAMSIDYGNEFRLQSDKQRKIDSFQEYKHYEKKFIELNKGK